MSGDNNLAKEVDDKLNLKDDDDDNNKLYDRWSLREESSISYGPFGNKDIPSGEGGGTYITTAINYTNGPAHMGHAYEATTSDALARYYRIRDGSDHVHFVTGTDEHGEKIAKTAEATNQTPIQLCDKYANGFKCLNQRILISNNDYIRTTLARHERTAQELWKKCAENGDIYLDSYSGWYNVREETFVTDSDAELCNYIDVASGKPLQQVEEASYFFKMSAYHDRLVSYIQDNPDFIRPEQHRNAILARLESDALRDLSISRTSFSWGIPVPEGFDSNHVMYVWFDALSNYLTGVDALGNFDDQSTTTTTTQCRSNLKSFWPANVHIIGKDILWFHTVIWPCMLMSAKLPLPKTVFAHGFVNDKEGKKMSKSLGNVVDPHDMLDKYPVDIFRWYLCKEAPYGGELSFSQDSLRDMHNADLCDTLGNLVHRATNLCIKYCHGIVPDVPPPQTPPIDFAAVRHAYCHKMDNFELEGGANIAMAAFRDVNGFLTEHAPWHMKGEEHTQARQIIVRATMEAVYALSHLLTPFLPDSMDALFAKFNTSPLPTLSQLNTNLRNLSVGTKIQVGQILYTKIISEEEKLDAAEAAKKKAQAYADAQKRKKEKKAKLAAASKAGQAATSAENNNQPEFTKMDIRVGQITKVWHHPEADKLFCEEINVGEDAPKEIASGLRQHYTLEQMQDRKVLVVCNLKASKIVGFVSNGMVLAAKGTDSKVELIEPPQDAAIGERVFIPNLTGGEPSSSAQVKKRKIWEKVAKLLKTNDEGIATWDNQPIHTQAGVCKAASLVGAPIS